MNQSLLLNLIEVTIAVVALLSFGALISILLRRPVLEGVATGLLFAAASSGVAFYISREFELSFWSFGSLSFCFLTVIIIGVRKFIFTIPYRGRSTAFHTWVIILAVSAIIGGVHLLTPYPQAGYSIFQGWNPLYLISSVEQGKFLNVSDMAFGSGFLARHAFYPTDTFSLAALLHLLTGLNAQATILAASISSVIAAFSILAFGLRRSPIALLGYAILFLFFLRYGHFFRTPLVGNIVDHLTYLAGATAIYYLSAGEAGRIARVGSALVLAPAVMSRPSGAVYSALFAISGFLTDLKQGVLRQTFWSWAFFSTVLGIMSFREILLLLQGGIFAARPLVMELYPPSFSKSFWGILADLGAIPHPNIFAFAIPMLSFSLLALLIVFFLKRREIVRRPRLIAIYLAPFLILIVPIVVEIITGFRKYSYGSKLYYVSLFFYPWYPWWLLSRFRIMQWWPQPVFKIFKYSAISGLIILILVTVLNFDFLFNRYAWAVDTYRINNVDNRMASAIRKNYSSPAVFKKIVATPVVYLYYEPGAGLRYYLGGDFFSDYDFWSDDFQKRMRHATRFEEVLKSLYYPNIYISHKHAIAGVSKWISSDAWKKFETEIRNLHQQSYVKSMISVGDAKFFITAPSNPGTK
jgi:hypothetical protein